MMWDLREPVSALSHGAGMLLALPVTVILWRRCGARPGSKAKQLALFIFGVSLAACYGSSALFHAARVGGETLDRLRRLDHVGIYLLIAGTYTPASWALLPGGLRRRMLAAVWGVAAACSAQVSLGVRLPVWAYTATYLAMGWGALFSYRELARTLGHARLAWLPLGGMLYSVGAVINLLGRPSPAPGVFGAHELFHFFVLAGTACHVLFMLRVVVPAETAAATWGAAWPGVPLDSGLDLEFELAPEANRAAAT
jgi:hemolysin III